VISEIEQHVPAAQAGDVEALRRLMHLVRPFVLRWCRARMGTQAGQEDVAQEVFRAIGRTIGHYRPGSEPFLGWVVAITRTQVADARRRNHRELTATRPVPDDVEAVGAADAGTLRRAAQLRGLLDQLPDDQQAILILRLVERLSVAETGRLLGMTTGSIRVGQHRALQRFREVLGTRVEVGEPDPTPVTTPIIRKPDALPL
jgi:RNA polymerase sigma-70 factor (ECF subfamily)